MSHSSQHELEVIIPAAALSQADKDGQPPIICDKSSAALSDDFPDGGYGWICVLVSFIFHFFAIGIESTWGVYQRDLFNNDIFPDVGNSRLAWVGSIQAAAPSLSGLIAGHVAQKIGYRYTSIVGIVLMSLGLTLASFSTQIWHLYLTQGMLFGFGSGLAFIMALTIVPQWFLRLRGLATGLAVSGSGIGGLVLSPLTQIMISRLGFRWALRITGIATLVILLVASTLLKTRGIYEKSSFSSYSSKQQSKVSKSMARIKGAAFLFLCFVGVCSGFGFYTPTFYVPDYATNNLGLSPTVGASAVSMISGLSALGRVLLGIFGDRFGHLHALVICQGMGGMAQIAIWPFTKNIGGLFSFCGVYGFFSGGFVSLYPVVAADLFGVENAAIVTGMLFSAYIPGTLASPPLYGQVIDHNSRPDAPFNFLPVQLASGACMLCAAASAFIVKMIASRAAVMRRHRERALPQGKEEHNANYNSSKNAVRLSQWVEAMTEIV